MLSYDRRKRHFQGIGGGGGAIFMLWNDSTIPADLDAEDPLAVTVGLKFRSSVAGDVIGVRFYKGDADNGGTHEGLLYDNAGNLLNSVTFAGETASGWQEQLFAAPTPILANTTYIIAYFAPQGHYSLDLNYFTASGFSNPPLLALQSGVDGGNGIFSYGAVPTFPVNTFNDGNYWIDLVFQT